MIALAAALLAVPDTLRLERLAGHAASAEPAPPGAHIRSQLKLTDRLRAAYQPATPGTRRLFNQAIFKRIWISREAVDHAELAEPFDELITISYFREVVRNAPPRRGAHRPRGRSRPSPRNDETSTAVSSRGGSNVEAMVRMRGLEPPRPEGHRHLKPARLPFRHIRWLAHLSASRVQSAPWRIASTEPNRTAARTPELRNRLDRGPRRRSEQDNGRRAPGGARQALCYRDGVPRAAIV